MSSEDEQIWQKNEEKIIEFVREFHEEVLEAEEKLPRTKAETLVIKALVRDMLRVRSKEKR